MKLQVKNYTFNKTSKTVSFTDYTSIDLDSILLITNVTDNIIIYNFASSGLGGSVLNNVLTLNYDTSLMSDSDDLQIFYDDSSKNQSTSEKQDSQITLETTLNSLVTILNSTVTTNDKTHLLLQQIRDSIAMPVDYVEASNAKQVVLAPSTLTTVSTVTNQTNIGGFSADMMTENTSYQDWGLSIRSLII